MSIDLMSLIGDIKTCLALVLGTGLLFGYLYTKLKAREIFKPEIKNLKKKIKHHQDKSYSLLSKNSDIEKELEGYESELHNYNLESTKQKEKLSEIQQKIRTLESDGVQIKINHQRQQKVLDNYNTEIKELKSKLGVEKISKIDEHKVNLTEYSKQIAQRYEQKCNSYKGFIKDETAIRKENHDLKSKLSSLTADLNKKGLELIDKNEIVSTLREKLQNEYEDLLANKKENETKIEQYRKQLLAIKDKLS